MSNIFVSYINLSDDLRNPFSSLTHRAIVGVLRNHFLNWKVLFAEYNDYDMGFTVVTKRGVSQLEVKGPTISRKMKVVDFSIFLPEQVEKFQPNKAEDVIQYLDLLFTGISKVLAKYEVAEPEIEGIKEQVKQTLNLIK